VCYNGYDSTYDQETGCRKFSDSEYDDSSASAYAFETTYILVAVALAVAVTALFIQLCTYTITTNALHEAAKITNALLCIVLAVLYIAALFLGWRNQITECAKGYDN
jgi:hypothetical protein